MTPSEKLKLPVIGKITAQLRGAVDGDPFESTIDEYEVIKILEQDGKKIYVCNMWNENDVPQLIPDICVLSFEEK